MARSERSARIIFSEGLLESQDPTRVPNGFLTQLVNLVPEPTGGLRARAKWFSGSTTGVPTTRRGRGIGMFSRPTAPAIAQTSAAVQLTWQGTTSAQEPILTWATPTRVGNLLLCVICFAKSSASGSVTLTPAAGWTARATISGSTQQQVGILEYPAAPVQSGDVRPFTIATSSSLPTSGVTCWLIEIAGTTTAPFDVQASATATGTSVAPVTGATAQASELVIGVDGARNASSGPGNDAAEFTLSTATADWAELLETGQRVSFTTGSDWAQGAVYYGTRTATGTQGLTFASSASVNHASVVLTYKGWYDGATVPETAKTWLVAAENDGGTIDVYEVDRDGLSSATFAVIDAAVATSDDRPVAFVNGLGYAYYTASSFTGGIRRYDGAAPATVSGSPIGARCIAAANDRLWVGGTRANPTRLYFSAIADGGTWTGLESGYFEVGRDDGEPIEDITPCYGGLLIGKQTSLWFLDGQNRNEFQLIQLNAGGAAQGRSLIATPWGAVAAAPEMVYRFDGATVEPIGRAIEASWEVGTDEFVSCSVVDGSLYIAAGANALVYVFDLDGGRWRMEQVGTTGPQAAAVLYNHGGTQLYAPVAGTVQSLLNFRTFPNPTRGPDEGLDTYYAARTGDVAWGGPRQPVTARNLFLQVRQRSGDASETGLTVTPAFSGEDADACTVGAEDVGVRRVFVEGFPQASGARADTVAIAMSQTLPAGETAVLEVEDCYLDLYLETGAA